jgi:hypothetical protein
MQKAWHVCFLMVINRNRPIKRDTFVAVLIGCVRDDGLHKPAKAMERDYASQTIFFASIKTQDFKQLVKVVSENGNPAPFDATTTKIVDMTNERSGWRAILCLSSSKIVK